MIPLSKPYLNEKEAEAAYKTVLSGWVTQGPRVQEFEEKFAQYVGSKYAIAVSNCTTALSLSLYALGLSNGDEVICPSFSYIATANAIVHVGGTPVFADVNQTFNLDPKETEKKISEKTKGIIIVHQIGFPADIDAFATLAQKYNLFLLEDAACAIGSTYKGKRIGSHSDLVCFSFHPRKVITTGDGGMITTSNDVLATRLRSLRQHAMSINDTTRHNSSKLLFEEYPEIGFNYRLTDIQASVGIEQLEKLNSIIEERNRIAKLYIHEFREFNSLYFQHSDFEYSTNRQSFMVYLKNINLDIRNKIMEKLLEKGISSKRGIGTAHREKAYINYNSIKLENSEKYSDQSIILPLYVPMEKEEINQVIVSFRSVLKEFKIN